MRKFILKVSLFLIGLGLLTNGLGRLGDRIAPLDDWERDHKTRLRELVAEQNSIESVTLGNSHSDSIDFDVMGTDGLSLALAAADLFELEKYVGFLDQKFSRLNTVFITISYYSFSRDNANFETLRPRRIGFYSILPIWTPIEGDLKNFLLGKIDAFTHVLSVTRSDNWEAVWTELLTPASPGLATPYDGVRTISEWGECIHYTEELLETHAREIAHRNVSSSREMARSHPGLERDAYEALARSIQQLQAKGIRVILVTPAYYEKYNEYFSGEGAEIIERMHAAVAQLQQTYQVEYYDFSEDPALTSIPMLFYNSDHLGNCGQKLFSSMLLKVMQTRNGDVTPSQN